MFEILNQVQRAPRERNKCTRAPPKIMPVSSGLNPRAHDLHIRKMRGATGFFKNLLKISKFT